MVGEYGGVLMSVLGPAVGGEVPLLDAVDDGRVGQRRGVAERLSSATSRSRRRMILPDRVLGRSSVKRMVFGLAMGPMTFATWSRISSTSAVAARCRPQRDERGDGLPGGGVGAAHHRGLGDRGVVDERVLDLGRWRCGGPARS